MIKIKSESQSKFAAEKPRPGTQKESYGAHNPAPDFFGLRRRSHRNGPIM
jgi:hypothetical protein